MPGARRYPLVPIILSGQQFAPCRNQRSAPIGEVSWFQSRRSVILCDRECRPRICAVLNRYDERFFVSCSLLQNGRIWYMHGVSDRDRTYFKLPERLIDSHDLVLDLFQQLAPPAHSREEVGAAGITN